MEARRLMITGAVAAKTASFELGMKALRLEMGGSSAVN
jgi:hypothetical protein